MSIFKKVMEASEAALDSYIAKSKSTNVQNEAYDRKGLIEIDYAETTQGGWKEKRGLVGPSVLKNMARRDSIISAIIKTRLTQVSAFSKPQKDKYSPGWVIQARNPADLTEEDKIKLGDPENQDEEQEYDKLRHKLEKKRMKLQKKQNEDKEKIKKFVLHGGRLAEETDTTLKRFDFDKFCKLIVRDRLIYNYCAIETVPNKARDGLSHFYPVDAGTIRYVSVRSAEKYIKDLKPFFVKQGAYADDDKQKPFKYVQVVRGKIVAAWTEDELVFEAANPTVDPEDYGYAVGELETLIQIVTAHLYAEAHNRNFFTQGIGTKGILHIKGENLSRAQLEAFKRQWFNQVVNSKNAFRPPIIGMADEVKWVSLAQTNREMEFEQWMNYLIRITCAIYQIDPAEINFDISKVNTSTLNESSNETRLKMSRDKGLRPLLDYVENIMNNHIIRYWDKELADTYEFKFVGLESETKMQEIERLKAETEVWKTVNEARVEMGAPPIEDGDIILNANFTQYKQMKIQMDQQEAQMAAEGEEGQAGAPEDAEAPDMTQDINELDKELESAIGDAEKEVAQAEKKPAEKEETKKSMPAIVEYYIKDDKDEN